MNEFNAKDAQKITKAVQKENKGGQPYLDIILEEIEEAAKNGRWELVLWKDWKYRMPSPDRKTELAVHKKLEEKGFKVWWTVNNVGPGGGCWRASWEASV